MRGSWNTGWRGHPSHVRYEPTSMSLYIRSRRPFSFTNAIAAAGTSVGSSPMSKARSPRRTAFTRGTIAAPANSATTPTVAMRPSSWRSAAVMRTVARATASVSAQATIGAESSANSARKRFRRAPARPSSATGNRCRQRRPGRMAATTTPTATNAAGALSGQRAGTYSSRGRSPGIRQWFAM